MPFSHQTGSPLFAIPSETRQAIYSVLIPRGILDIELCTTSRQSTGGDTSAVQSRRHKSPIAALRQQIDALSNIKQTNGIHLLLVCQWMRLEVLELLASVTVRFHCPECFNTFLPNAARGLGVGVEWMKTVEILLVVRPGSQAVHHHPQFDAYDAFGVRHPGPDGWTKAQAEQIMQNCQREAWKWYGPLHLTEREKWTCDPVRIVSHADIARATAAQEHDDDDTDQGPVAALGPAINGLLAQHPELAMHALVVLPVRAANAGEEVVSLQWLITGKFNI
ncbi:hypothetical protein DV735_g4027, partial [Chaetothyriales sp. CBS 134920]